MEKIKNSLYNDVIEMSNNLFQENSSNQLKKLLHSCVDEICGFPGPLYHQYALELDWSEDEYNKVYKLFTGFIKNPVCLYLDDDKMPHDYHELPEFLQKDLKSCLKSRREQVTNSLITETMRKKGTTVVDFDWRLKLIMGSSKMASIKEPVLQLDLIVEGQKEKDERLVTIEMNQSELDTLINALEPIVVK